MNDPAALQDVLVRLGRIRSDFAAGQSGGRRVSLADLIVLAGNAGVEKAANNAGVDVRVAFTPGRTDAPQEQNDAPSFAPIEPRADGFRNDVNGRKMQFMKPEEAFVDRARLLGFTGPEMTVLLGGLRVLGANAGNAPQGAFTRTPGWLTPDVFVSLLDMRTTWSPAAGQEGVHEGRDRRSGDLKWTGTRVDLVYGSHSRLRAYAEVYASIDAREKFARDFVAAWTKVMNADRFDLARA